MYKHIIRLSLITFLSLLSSCDLFAPEKEEATGAEVFGNIHSIYFINSNEGWAGGSDYDCKYGIFHTTDSGNTWKLQFSYAPSSGCAEPMSIDQIYFLSSQEGWASSEFNEVGQHLFYTSNGGKDWKLINDGDYGKPIKFFNSKDGWGGPFKTTDGGYTWLDMTGNINPGFPNYVDIIDTNTIWAAKRANENSTIIWRSTNSGHTWEKKTLPPESFSYITAISFVDSLNGFVISNNTRKIAITNNGGKTWTITTLDIQYFVDGKMLSPTEIWLDAIPTEAEGLDSDGRLFHTANAGKTWKKLDYPDKGMDKLFFLNSTNTIWWYSDSRGAYKSGDGGNTWKKLDWKYIK